MIRRNVELEAQLIDDLLDVMRIARGKLVYHRAVEDAHALIEQAVEICRGDVDAGRVALVLDLSAARHHVEGDAARLKQVVWNLIKNAVKFTPAGGTIAIRTRNADAPGAGRPGRSLIIEVADTGIGIDPDLLPRIFDAFEQGESDYARRIGGLGLGLAICRSVVEAHGGRLRAASAGKGQGATFTVELATVPAPAAADRPAAGPADGPAGPRPLTILLVEDDPSSLKIMAKLLRQGGHRVATADGIASALRGRRGRRLRPGRHRPRPARRRRLRPAPPPPPPPARRGDRPERPRHRARPPPQRGGRLRRPPDQARRLPHPRGRHPQGRPRLSRQWPSANTSRSELCQDIPITERIPMPSWRPSGRDVRDAPSLVSFT